jgi:hypothetical protein
MTNKSIALKQELDKVKISRKVFSLLVDGLLKIITVI